MFNFVTGGGSSGGQELIDNPGIDGIVFTGSKDVGLKMLRDNAARPVPRPVIAELGGKNPALVMRSADLDKATDGVIPLGVWRPGSEVLGLLARVRAQGAAGSLRRTSRREDEEDQESAIRSIGMCGLGPSSTRPRSRRSRMRGSRRSTADGADRREANHDGEHGYFVEPTVIDGLPVDHPVFAEEYFVPIGRGAVLTLDEALELANRSEYRLTAGIFSEDQQEIQQFFDGIQAGVTYANRRAGATTGAWPGINPFGGWKASGSSGRGTGGPYYVQQFMREQSRVRIR